MKRFIKNNLLLIIIISLALLVSLGLLVYAVLVHIEMLNYNEQIEKVRNDISKLNNEKPKPVAENISRLKADSKIYIKKAEELRHHFGFVYQAAVDAFMAKLGVKNEDGSKMTFRQLSEKFRSDYDKIDVKNVAEQGVFYRKFQRDYPNWSDAVKAFGEVAKNITTEPLNERSVDELLLAAMGIPRYMEHRLENLDRFMSGYRVKLVEMANNNKVYLNPASSYFSFNSAGSGTGGAQGYAAEEIPVIATQWDVIGDIFKRLIDSDIKTVESINKRSINGEQVGDYKVFNYTFEVVGTLPNIRKFVENLNKAYADNRIYVVRSVFLTAVSDDAKLVLHPVEEVVVEEKKDVNPEIGMMPQEPNTRSGRRTSRTTNVNPDTMPGPAADVSVSKKPKIDWNEENKKPYNERYGYGDILIGGKKECKASIVIEYVVDGNIAY